MLVGWLENISKRVTFNKDLVEGKSEPCGYLWRKHSSKTPSPRWENSDLGIDLGRLALGPEGQELKEGLDFVAAIQL